MDAGSPHLDFTLPESYQNRYRDQDRTKLNVQTTILLKLMFQRNPFGDYYAIKLFLFHAPNRGHTVTFAVPSGPGFDVFSGLTGFLASALPAV